VSGSTPTEIPGGGIVGGVERTELSGRTAAPGGAVARLVVLCGLLLGLFLMHGSPASAASGCHRPSATAMADPADSPHGGADTPHGGTAEAGTPMSMSMSMVPMATTTATAPTDADRWAHAAPALHSGAESCLSTQSRSTVHPAAGPGLTLAVAAVPPLVPAAAGPGDAADGCRAPPYAGRELLLKVCVART